MWKPANLSEVCQLPLPPSEPARLRWVPIAFIQTQDILGLPQISQLDPVDRRVFTHSLTPSFELTAFADFPPDIPRTTPKIS